MFMPPADVVRGAFYSPCITLLVRVPMRIGAVWSAPPTSCIQHAMCPEAGGSRLERHSPLIGNEEQNLGRRTLHRK